MIQFLISYEGTTVAKLDELFEGIQEVEEHFDASHVDGTEIYAVSVNAPESASKKWQSKLREAVWTVNGGLSVTVRGLTADEFDDYC